MNSVGLYISGIRSQLLDADATNYISRVIIRGIKSDGTTDDINDANPPTSAWNSIDEHEITFTAVDSSSYREIIILLQMIVDTANNFDLGGLQIRGYYE